MSLGLSNVGAQISSIHDQNSHSSDLLRLGGSGGGAGRTGQFDHILQPSLGSSSSFRHPQQTMPSPAAFFMPESNQNYHDQHQHQRGTTTTLVQNKPFHGLMQFSDLQNNTTTTNNNNNSPTGAAANNTNLFNLPFLYNSNTGAGGNPNSFPEHFTNGSSSGTGTGGNEGSNFFSGTIMGDQTSSSAPSLFSTSLQNNSAVPHMSATALLQKAAQIGASSSNNNGTVSLLRSFGNSSSSSGGGGGSNSKPDHKSSPLINASSNYTNMFTTGTDQNNNLHDLMNSFASGSFESGSVGLSGFEASERLSTRDFLGVGQIVRSMSGNISQREQQQQQGFNLSSLETERNAAAPSAQSFGGGGGNFQ